MSRLYYQFVLCVLSTNNVFVLFAFLLNFPKVVFFFIRKWQVMASNDHWLISTVAEKILTQHEPRVQNKPRKVSTQSATAMHNNEQMNNNSNINARAHKKEMQTTIKSW